MSGAPEKTAAEIEKEQEEKLMKKYGGMGGPGLLGRGRGRGRGPAHLQGGKDTKYFDSADWQMQKRDEKDGKAPVPDDEKVEDLPAKIKPSPPPSRRVSHLDSMDTARDMV